MSTSTHTRDRNAAPAVRHALTARSSLRPRWVESVAPHSLTSTIYGRRITGKELVLTDGPAQPE